MGILDSELADIVSAVYLDIDVNGILFFIRITMISFVPRNLNPHPSQGSGLWVSRRSTCGPVPLVHSPYFNFAAEA
jgi:hypothetical protein